MSAKYATILLVEDDEVDAMNVKRAFKKVGIANSLYIAFFHVIISRLEICNLWITRHASSLFYALCIKYRLRFRRLL